MEFKIISLKYFKVIYTYCSHQDTLHLKPKLSGIYIGTDVLLACVHDA